MEVDVSHLPTPVPRRGTLEAGPVPLGLRLRGYHPLRRSFPEHFDFAEEGAADPKTPHPRRLFAGAFGLGSFPFARRYSGNPCWFLLLPLLRCFSSGGSRSSRSTALTDGGKSHSGILGSTAACAYPRLIAACHALHRLPSLVIHQIAYHVSRVNPVPSWSQRPMHGFIAGPSGGPLALHPRS